MIVYREERRRVPEQGLYGVQSYCLFGVILIFRRWVQLTTWYPTPGERD